MNNTEVAENIEDPNTVEKAEAVATEEPKAEAVAPVAPVSTGPEGFNLPEDAVRVGEEDAATISAAHNSIFKAQQSLGRLREQYMIDENAALSTITQSRKNLDGVLLTLAKKHDIDIEGGQWVFLADVMAFVPRPKQ
jgi:hypothetical protein